MARRTHVPQFGIWDANDHMPYTVVFNNARQGRGKPVNPNDPSENPDLSAAGRGNGAPGRRFNPSDQEDTGIGSDLPYERTAPSREGSSRGHTPPQAGRRQERVAPTQGNGMPSRPPPADPRRSREGLLDRSVESPTPSFSSDHSPSHVPSFPSSQGRGIRTGSPAWESRRKTLSEDGPLFAPPTPNRSRLRGGKDDGSAKGPSAALPMFGDWDAQDPGSGDGFTVIFNNARNERKSGGPVNIPRTTDHKHPDDLYENPNIAGYQRAHGSKKSWFCWCGPEVKS